MAWGLLRASTWDRTAIREVDNPVHLHMAATSSMEFVAVHRIAIAAWAVSTIAKVDHRK